MDDDDTKLDTNVLVAVRCRPFNNKEKGNGEQSCIRIHSDQIVLVNPAGNGDDHSFGFDLIFDESSRQEDIWKEVGLPILNKALAGYNGTIFAYGQTGSGKTWSMQGGDGDLEGIIPRMNSSIFDRIAEEKLSRPTVQFLVTVSYFEIYNEVIFDLLDPTDRKKRMNTNKGGLEIKEHPALGVYVKGLQEIVTENVTQLEAIIEQGMKHRTVASTQMNADSSRSHSVFVVSIHQKDEANAGSNIFAKMNLVDLAGSERVKSTGATGATLKEGANINKSLSALGNVINALVECSKGKAVFIPYRNSKLTRVLQESLGGNSITSMLAACSPAASSFEETLSTLKYANRAKAIKVKAVKNEEATQVNRLQDEIRLLKEKLQQQQPGDGAVLDDKAKARLKDLEEAVKNTWEQKAELSSQYEHERAQLVAEQQYAYRQLQLAKEKAWSMLLQKEQMDSVILHMKDCISNGSKSVDDNTPETVESMQRSKSNKANLQTVGALGDTTGLIASISAANCDSVKMTTVCDFWLSVLQQLSAKEQSAKDELMVLNMVKTALQTDTQTFAKLQGQAASRSLDHNYLQNLLEQMKEKILSLCDGVPRFLRMQEDITVIYSNLSNQYQHVSGQFSKHLQQSQSQAASAEVNGDIRKCLDLLNTLAQSKQRQTINQINISRKDIIDFGQLNEEIIKAMAFYEQYVQRMQAENADIHEDTSHQNIMSLLAGCYKAVENMQALNAGNADHINSITSTMSNVLSTKPAEPAVIRPAPKATKSPSIFSLTHAFMRTLTGQLQLPCGVSLASIRNQAQSFPSSNVASGGDSLPLVVTTEAALGDVFSWEKLLGTKQNPQKLLQRPPLRFLCDLSQHIISTCLGGNIHLMDGLEQQADFESKTWQALTMQEALAPLRADWTQVNATKESKLAYMDKLLRFVSKFTIESGDAVTTAANIVTGSRTELSNLFLQQLAVVIFAIRQHFKSQGEMLGEMDTNDGVRAALPEPHQLEATTQESFVCPTVLLSDGSVQSYLNGMKALLQETVGVVKSVVAYELHLRSLRQDLQKKNMELLAQEKAQLAQAMANEKQSLLSNNQSLSEQVAVYQAQLEEMKRLLDKEAQYSANLESIRDGLQVEGEKLQKELQEKEEQVHKLSSQVFKHEAVMEKDKLLIHNLQHIIETNEISMEACKAQLASCLATNEQLQAEKEEVNDSIQVLTEERDAARQHEEDLFENLNEVNTSLENLQESYVYINDKCNDLFDENLELKDEVSRLKEALIEAQRQALHSSIPALSNGNSRSSHVQTPQPQASPAVHVASTHYPDDGKAPVDMSADSQTSPRASIVRESKKASSKSVSPVRVASTQPSDPSRTVQMTHDSHHHAPVSGNVHRTTDDVLISKSAPNSVPGQMNKGNNTLSSSSMEGHQAVSRMDIPDAEDDYEEDFDDEP